jgi:putative transposase
VPRIARVVAVGAPHHVTRRGNNRQKTFLSDADRRVYLAVLGAHCRHWGVALLGSCLMANPVHMAAVPRAANALGTGSRDTGSGDRQLDCLQTQLSVRTMTHDASVG